MKSWKPEAIILAIGMLIMGYFIKNGLDTFAGKDRVVTVKGLAEMEVPANKVTWPLMYKEVGNDLPTLYNKINNTNQTIVTFLKQKGITEQEISINAPELIDLQADRYNSNPIQFRYNITTVITVTSDKVELVRNLIKEQSELLKQGIAITGGDYRYNVQYDFTGLNAVKPQMIEEATAFYPNITLSGTLGWTNNGGGVIVNPGQWLLNAIGSLTQPLFNRGTNIANLKIAKSRQEEAKLLFRQSLLNAGKEVNDALTAWQTAKSQIEINARQVETLCDAVRKTESLMRHSNATYLEVLTAQQSLLEAEVQQLQTRFERIQSVIKLYHVLGGGM